MYYVLFPVCKTGILIMFVITSEESPSFPTIFTNAERRHIPIKKLARKWFDINPFKKIASNNGYEK